jgi:hypothetical protein
LIAKALKESKEKLLEIIEMWAISKRLETFFTDAEQRLEGLSEGERDHMIDRLQRARTLPGYRIPRIIYMLIYPGQQFIKRGVFSLMHTQTELLVRLSG